MIAYVGKQFHTDLRCDDCGALIPSRTDCLTFCDTTEQTYADFCKACAPSHKTQAEELGILPKQRAILEMWEKETEAKATP